MPINTKYLKKLTFLRYTFFAKLKTCDDEVKYAELFREENRDLINEIKM